MGENVWYLRNYLQVEILSWKWPNNIYSIFIDIITEKDKSMDEKLAFFLEIISCLNFFGVFLKSYANELVLYWFNRSRDNFKQQTHTHLATSNYFYLHLPNVICVSFGTFNYKWIKNLLCIIDLFRIIIYLLQIRFIPSDLKTTWTFLGKSHIVSISLHVLVVALIYPK